MQVVYFDFNYYFGVCIMLAKIYYEQDEEEVLFLFIVVFIIFFKCNKQVFSVIKEIFLNFCDLFY